MLSWRSDLIIIIIIIMTFAVWRVCYQKVTDATVAAVSANCLELTTLCLSKCDNITDEALTMLSQGCLMLTLVYTCLLFVCILSASKLIRLKPAAFYSRIISQCGIHRLAVISWPWCWSLTFWGFSAYIGWAKTTIPLHCSVCITAAFV